jgi:hypothetical protein
MSLGGLVFKIWISLRITYTETDFYLLQEIESAFHGKAIGDGSPSVAWMLIVNKEFFSESRVLDN